MAIRVRDAQAERAGSSDAICRTRAPAGRSTWRAACSNYFGGMRMPPSTRIVSAFM